VELGEWQSVRVLATELTEHVGQTTVIAGWVHRRRQLKSVTFVIIRDRSGLAQVVTNDSAVIEQVAQLPEETVVEITGQVIANPQAPNGVELTQPSIRVISDFAAQPPFDIYRPNVAATLPVILDNAPVALRHSKLRAPFEIGAASAAGFRAALERLQFTEIFTPKIVRSATESGANVFGIDYFERRAFLAQSPQLYKQTMVGVFERVYEIAPVFRAEPHDTARHLAEYVSMDAEFGFISDHHDVMAVLCEAIKGMIGVVASHATRAVKLLGIELPSMPNEIPEIDFSEAQEMIAKYGEEDPRGEPDLAPAHERWLCEWALREFDCQFLFVTGYPMVKRPFYTHPDPERPEYTNSFDLLFRGQELVTGGQRLHRYSDYLTALAARNEDPQNYASYLAAFEHGMPPHGGFAIGLERWVSRLMRADNIRSATLFPRDIQRLEP
jgi:nondiscriminating aspartyl-tRNA synthetase